MGTKDILIIEDEVVIRSSIRKFLHKQGYKVSEAGSVAEATAFNLTNFDLIITDLRLPGAIGTDIIKQAPDIPVLVMTSYASVTSAVARTAAHVRVPPLYSAEQRQAPILRRLRRAQT